MNYLICIILIVLGITFRLVPHAPNFTPILSIALLSGFYFKNKLSFLLPVFILLISDIIIGSYTIAPFIYLSILAIYVFGYFYTKNKLKNIFLSSVSSAFIFYILSNFGVWCLGGYTYTINGFFTCYWMAVPFFYNTLISTIFFSCSIYIICNAISSLYLKKQKIHL